MQTPAHRPPVNHHAGAEALTRRLLEDEFALEALAVDCLSAAPFYARALTPKGCVFIKEKPWYLSDAEFAAALAIQSAFFEAGAPCEELLPARDGKVVVKVAERTFRISRWIQPDPVRQLSAAELGALLGQLHTSSHAPAVRRLAVYRGSPRRYRSWPDDFESMKVFSGKLWEHSLSPPLPEYRELERQLEAAGQALANGRASVQHEGSCHGDVSVVNIISSSNGAAFVDFDDARTMPYVYELAWAILAVGLFDFDQARQDFMLEQRFHVKRAAALWSSYGHSFSAEIDREALRFYLRGLIWPTLQHTLERRGFMRSRDQLAHLTALVSESQMLVDITRDS
jgi:hypothetical protein